VSKYHASDSTESVKDPLAVDDKVVKNYIGIITINTKWVQICKLSLRLSENLTLFNSRNPASSTQP